MNRRISVIASCSVQYPCCVLCLFALIAMFYVLRCMYVSMPAYLRCISRDLCFVSWEARMDGREGSGDLVRTGGPSVFWWVGGWCCSQNLRYESIHSFIQSINLFISYERTKNKSSSYTMTMIQVSIPNQARQENQRPTNRFEDGTARLENQRTTR